MFSRSSHIVIPRTGRSKPVGSIEMSHGFSDDWLPEISVLVSAGRGRRLIVNHDQSTRIRSDVPTRRLGTARATFGSSVRRSLFGRGLVALPFVKTPLALDLRLFFRRNAFLSPATRKFRSALHALVLQQGK